MLSRRDRRWNFAACLIDAVGWPLGAALISLQTIFPVFLGRLGAGNLAVGALTALYNLLLFLPGLGVAGYISRLRQARGYLFWVALAERLALVPLAALTLLWGRMHPHWLLATVFVCIGFHATMMGLNQPAYWVVVGKCVPARWRGRLFGYAGGVAGLLGLGVERLLHHSLSGPAGGFPDGYGHLFFLAFAVMTVSVLPLGSVRGATGPAPRRGTGEPLTGSPMGGGATEPRPLAGGHRLSPVPPSPDFGDAGGAGNAVFRAGRDAAAARGRLRARLYRDAGAGGCLRRPGLGGLERPGGNRRVLLAASACLALARLFALYAHSDLAFYGVFARRHWGRRASALRATTS